MTASILGLTFDAMRGRLAPAAAMSEISHGQAHRGNNTPVSGKIVTDKTVSGVNDAVSLSASYRAKIGQKGVCVINDTTINNVVVIDCRTSYISCASGRRVEAEWTLAAPYSWNP